MTRHPAPAFQASQQGEAGMRAQLPIGDIKLVDCTMPQQKEQDRDGGASGSTGCRGGRVAGDAARDRAAVVVVVQGGERGADVGGGDSHGAHETKGEIVEVWVERAHEVELTLALGAGARVAHAAEGDHAQDVEQDVVGQVEQRGRASGWHGGECGGGGDGGDRKAGSRWGLM